MSEYDSPWKEALDVYFPAFLEFFFPVAFDGIDWPEGYEMLDKELQEIVPETEIGRKIVDKLVKVRRKTGEEEWVLVHVEVQSQEQIDFAERMYVYNYRLFDRYNRKVVSVAILGDDKPDWKPDRFGYSLWGCTVGIEFPIIKLLELGENWTALETSSNPFAVVVMAHLKTLETRRDPNERYSWKVRLVKGLYERGFNREDIRQLFRFIDWIMDLPEALEKIASTEFFRIEGEKHMPYVTSVERFGIEKGLRQGLLEAVELGLTLKFGPEGLDRMQKVRSIESVEVLRKIVAAIKTASSIEELEEFWS